MPTVYSSGSRHRSLRTAAARIAAVLALASTGVAPAIAAQPRVGAPASSNAAEGRLPRKILYSVVGAVLGTGMYYAYDRMSLGGERGNGCAPDSCALPYLSLAGALAGFFAGYERDQSYALRYRYGTPVEFATSTLSLRGEQVSLAVGDTLVAVAGSEGVHVIGTGGPRLRSVALRAAGFSGLSAVAFAEGGQRLGVASAQSVALLPPVSGRGVLARERGAEVLVATAGGLFVGEGATLEWIPDGMAGDSVGPWAGISLGAPIRSGRVGPSGALTWFATDSGVVAVRPTADAPEVVRRVPTPFPARAVALSPDQRRLAVALGNRGLAVYAVSADGSVAGTPLRWEGAQYAYDVAWLGGDLFVAAGTEGLYRLSVSEDAVNASELARDVGFPTALERRGSELFLLDRSAGALVRVEP
jgi:hypothetical protein